MSESDLQRPPIAVVIACFNDGATLSEAVRSVLVQERPAELVVVDDGSTDPETVAVCDALAREGVHVIRRENGGCEAARMTAVAATHAEYVLALDADDRLLPGALATLGEALDGDPRLALVWGDYELFGEREWRQATADTLDAWAITYQNEIPVTMLVRREALLDAGGWSPAGSDYSDWDLLMGLAERGACGRRVRRSVYEHRVHGMRYGARAWQRHEWNIGVLRERHPSLFARRRGAWRRSSAPLAMRLSLPVIEQLPLSSKRRFALGNVATHLARRRGVGLIVALVRGQNPGR